MIDIVIPVKHPINIKYFLNKNRTILEKNNLIVIDSGGGELLESIAKVYVKKSLSIWNARKEGYLHSKTPFILNLDSDVILPANYVEEVLNFFADENVGAVSSFFSNKQHRGVLEFGCSVWRSDILRSLYDYDPKKFNEEVVQISSSNYSLVRNGYCECLYMWERLNLKGLSVKCVNLPVEHFKF